MKKSFKKIGLLISTTPAFNPNYVTVEMNIIGEITRDLVVIHVCHEVDFYATYLTKHNGAWLWPQTYGIPPWVQLFDQLYKWNRETQVSKKLREHMTKKKDQ